MDADTQVTEFGEDIRVGMPIAVVTTRADDRVACADGGDELGQ
jgi:hypothetical protein